MEQQPSEDVSPIEYHDSLHPRHAISCCATLLESPAPDLVPISMCTVKTVLKSLNLVHLGIWEVLHMKTRGEEVAERDKVLVVWQLYGSVKVPVAAPYILSPAKFSLSAT